MTTLLSWAVHRAGDHKAPSSVYFASDSRITWSKNTSYWDGARKIFTCRMEPHMFGYCGDVVFPSLVLAQIVSVIDNGLLFEDGTDVEEMHAAVYEALKKSFELRRNVPNNDFWVLHALRRGEEEERSFSVQRIYYSAKQKEWETAQIPIPPKTGVIALLGSGTALAKKHIDCWVKSDVGARSSAFFSGFCDAIYLAKDPHSGGVPQIASLNPGSHAQNIGFIANGKRYLHGLEVEPRRILHRIKWRDRHFQNINPLTLKLGAGERRLIRPRGVCTSDSPNTKKTRGSTS